MKKTNLTRSLMAACSIVALSAVMYGCVHGGDDAPPAMEMPPDADGDGVADADDAFPNDPTESADSDGDGVGNNADAFPMDATETVDTDGDGMGDNADLDDDNDGVADVHDALPLNPMETADTDGDGVGDNADLDDDGDGVLDANDAFPKDAAETADADGDGVGDNADAFPMDAAEQMDSDMDGVGDNADAFPMDATETADADGDGAGDNADLDDDNDGYDDAVDAFPTDPAEWADANGDGLGDNANPPEHMVDLMGSEDLMAGTTTIPAGGSVTVGQTTIECPAGGEDCVLTVSEDAVTGLMTASATGAAPTVTVAPVMYAVDLPQKHSLMDGDTITVDAGESVEMGGVSFTCPAGGEDCVVTISENDDGDLVASATGAEATAAQVTPRGYQAFMDLSDTILATGIPNELADLQANIYHGNRAGGGSGVTSSVTTHEDPTGTNPNVTGVSDIMVSVAASATDPTSDDDTSTLTIVDVAANQPTPAPTYDFMEAMLKDGSTAWNGDLDATATWSGNPAAGWKVEDLDLQGDANMDDDADDIWTAYFQHTQDLSGGRTLELDLRSDFVPGHANHVTYDAANQTIVRGPGGTYDEVTVSWDNVMADIFPLTLGTEVDLSTDGGVGLEGGYANSDGDFVMGRFVCIDGGADGGQADGECKVDHQTNGQMGVSEEDTIVFLPYVHGVDSNWLTAGVWLTIPQDEEDGDYAIGAFVFGNDPVEPTAADAWALGGNTPGDPAGTATYNGEAFGRYAEDMDVGEGAMMVGRFTADVELTADFGDDGANATENNYGTIQGDVTGFMVDGESRNWDVNFESAMIMQADDPANPGQGLDNTALRFNAGASGHGDGGEALTGYWNGQFYGDATQAHNDGDPIAANIQTPWGNVLPGSAAGTFGLTSERDANDDYSLIMEGAFVTHQEGANGAPQSN